MANSKHILRMWRIRILQQEFAFLIKILFVSVGCWRRRCTVKAEQSSAVFSMNLISKSIKLGKVEELQFMTVSDNYEIRDKGSRITVSLVSRPHLFAFRQFIESIQSIVCARVGVAIAIVIVITIAITASTQSKFLFLSLSLITSRFMWLPLPVFY